MFYSKTRVAFLACGLVAVLFLAPSASEAAPFDWLCPSSVSSAPSATTFAPPYTAQRISYRPFVGATTVYSPSIAPRISYRPIVGATTVYSPIAQTAFSPVGQTCYYTPQTTYRWSYSRIERTSYRPVTSVDPCTGCATTTYQPVVRRSLLPWIHRKPVTAYQLTCNSVCAPTCTTACSPCGPSACSSCGVFGSAPTLNGSSCPTGCAPVTTYPGPSTSSDPGYSPQTFKAERPTEPAPSTNPAPSPDVIPQPGPALNGNPASTEKIETPKLIHPGGRTASRPVRYATYQQPIPWTPPVVTPISSTLDVGGWRASRE